MRDIDAIRGMAPVGLGATGLRVTPVRMGCAVLGSDPEAFGYEVGLDRALATLRRVFGGPFNFVDTSNNYGGGESERRIGTVLGELGGLPEGFVLASKVDPDPVTGAFFRATCQTLFRGDPLTPGARPSADPLPSRSWPYHLRRRDEAGWRRRGLGVVARRGLSVPHRCR